MEKNVDIIFLCINVYEFDALPLRFAIWAIMGHPRAVVVGQLQRRLSLAAVHSQGLSLHGSLQALAAAGQGQLQQRRQQAQDAAFAMARDRAAFFAAQSSGQFRVRRGFGKTD